jgi:hypothetical protein
MKLALSIGMKSDAASTIGLKTRISRFDDKSERCSAFEALKTLQKFSSVHAQVHDLFNQERHLVTRQVYKQRRSTALAEWRVLAA